MPDSGKALVRSPTGVLSPPGTINVPNFHQRRQCNLESLDSGVDSYFTELLHINASTEDSNDDIDRIRPRT